MTSSDVATLNSTSSDVTPVTLTQAALTDSVPSELVTTVNNVIVDNQSHAPPVTPVTTVPPVTQGTPELAAAASTAAATFAHTTELLKENNSSWLVKARKNKKSVTVIGKENSSALKGVAPVSRNYWDLSVSRLAESTTDDQVKRHLQNHGIEVKEVFVFASKIRGTKSAKVRVSIEHRDKAKNGELWPLYCRIQDWIYKAKSQSATNEK